MADRQRRVRERPIDFTKPMPVVKGQKELSMGEDGQLVPKKREEDDLDPTMLGSLDEEEDVRDSPHTCCAAHFFCLFADCMG